MKYKLRSLAVDILKRFRFARKARRSMLAARDVSRSRQASFSQHGEDRLLLAKLQQEPDPQSVYMDIGANHPTRLSNTYLLYRHGLSGICVDANREFRGVWRQFRPRDTFLCFGVSEAPGIFSFRRADADAFAGFGAARGAWPGMDEWVPCLPVDCLLPLLGTRPLFLLSVDVEGLNLSVLKGARQTLARARYVVVEFDHDEDRQAILDFLGASGFKLMAQCGCNLVMERQQSGTRIPASS